jgi:cytochrome P450
MRGAVVATDPPVTSVTFTEPRFNQDPYPVLEAVRAAGPVVYNEARDRFMVTSYQHVSRCLGDTVHFKQYLQTEGFESVFGGLTMEMVDVRERHDAIRGIWAKDFERSNLEGRRELVEQVDDQLDPFVERVRSGETVDAVAAMTRRIPTLVVAHLLGIETSMIDQFSDWSDAMAGIAEGALDLTEAGRATIAEGRAATIGLNEYLAHQVTERRGCPSEDLIGKMVASPYAQSDMTEQEIVASNTQLVFAGNETTAKLMAHALVTLAAHPDQRRRLVDDRSLVPAAVEEVHRFQTIAQFMDRFVRADVEIEGVALPKRSVVTALEGAANRDPGRWDDASSFDVTRPARQHLGFGFGMHSCIGLNLARLEATIWLDRLLDRLPEFEVVGDVDYGKNFQIRGPLAVHVAA